MSNYDKGLPEDFEDPAGLPESDEQAKKWQQANRAWWEKNPMRYDWKEVIEYEEYSNEFFQEIDNRFFSKVWEYMPWKKRPFDPIAPYDELVDKDVLEIGVGNGSVAQRLASVAKTFTGIDLTDYAYKSTSKRMEAFGLNVTIRQMDAEKMEFDDASFDYIWSWGVIHHSSNTGQILKEMHRVLRPGGTATIMVYYRNLWNYWFCAGFLRGILMGKFFKLGSINAVMQQWWDGAIARFYTTSEWEKAVSPYFNVKKTIIYGGKPELVPLPGGKFKNFVLFMMPNSLGRFMGTACRMGTFLVTELERKDGEPNR